MSNQLQTLLQHTDCLPATFSVLAVAHSYQIPMFDAPEDDQAITPIRAGTHTKPGRPLLDMGLGGTAKKLQKVTDMAEDVYARLNDLREQIVGMRETTQETSDRVDRLERETAEVRALVEALAEAEGVDVERVTAEAHIAEAEGDGDDPDADASSNDAVDGGN